MRHRHAERFRQAGRQPGRPGRGSDIPAIEEALAMARASRMRVVYGQDTHRPGDPKWGVSGPSTAVRGAGAGRSLPSWHRASTRSSFAKLGTTRSMRLRSTNCCGTGVRHARHLRARSRRAPRVPSAPAPSAARQRSRSWCRRSAVSSALELVESELNRDVVTAFPVTEAVGKLEPGVYVMTARPPGKPRAARGG